MMRWLGAPAVLTVLLCMHACSPGDVQEAGRLVIVGGAIHAKQVLQDKQHPSDTTPLQLLSDFSYILVGGVHLSIDAS